MPPETENKAERRVRSGSTVSIVLWWQKIHFSGRVIMCSVLFGLGLVLIGGIIFAINVNDDGSKSGDDFLPNEMPSKPPSNVVGPAIMGIGGFIVTVGIIMCLFETQVCRKKTADSSPLIPENPSDTERTESKPEEVPQKSHSHGHGHKHGARKGGASPKRSKNHHVKSRSKDKKGNTPPLSIDTSKSFMTSSEEKFLTPPNTIEYPPQIPRETREAENQTSASLMKSFTSSGPSWTQSSEFQTPSTSFRDSSVSLENSTEVDVNKEEKNAIPTELLINSGFMTPIVLEEEKVQKMATQIQNRNKAELNSLSEQVTSSHFGKTIDQPTAEFKIATENENLKLIEIRNAIQPNVITTSESKIGIENEDLNILETGNAIQPNEIITAESKIGTENEDLKLLETGNSENRSNVIEDPSLAVPEVITAEEIRKIQDTDFINKHDLLQVEDSKNASDEGPDIIQETTVDNEISNQTSVTAEEEANVVPQSDQSEKLKPEEVTPESISTLEEKEQPSLLHEDKEALLKDADRDNTDRDLESSTSSDETVVSESSVLEKAVNVAKFEENESEKLHLTNQDVNLDTAKSNGDTTPGNDIKPHSNHSNMPGENEVEITDSKPMQNDIKVDESSANVNKNEAEEGTILSKADFVDTHYKQSDTSNGNEDGTTNLTHSEKNEVKDVHIEEHTKINSS